VETEATYRAISPPGFTSAAIVPVHMDAPEAIAHARKASVLYERLEQTGGNERSKVGASCLKKTKPSES